MSPIDLHLLQLELECKGATDDDRLVRVRGDEPDDLELARLTRRSDGRHRLLVRHDVARSAVERVRMLDLEGAFARPELVREALGLVASVKWSRGRSYVFPPGLESPLEVAMVMPEVSPGDPSEPWMRRPTFVVRSEGKSVSCCRSSRENSHAAEAWVETEQGYRRRGFARLAVVAWACHVKSEGKEAFYSHLEENPASAALAKSLTLVEWLSFVNFELGENG